MSREIELKLVCPINNEELRWVLSGPKQINDRFWTEVIKKSKRRVVSCFQNCVAPNCPIRSAAHSTIETLSKKYNPVLTAPKQTVA